MNDRADLRRSFTILLLEAMGLAALAGSAALGCGGNVIVDTGAGGDGSGGGGGGGGGAGGGTTTTTTTTSTLTVECGNPSWGKPVDVCLPAGGAKCPAVFNSSVIEGAAKQLGLCAEVAGGDCCNEPNVAQVLCGLPGPAGSCCYTVEVQDSGLCIGRPFTVGGAARSANAAARSDWSHGLTPRCAGLDVSTRAALVREWTLDARMEHASVASFARLALVFLLGAAALFSVEPALPLAAYPLVLLWAMRGRRGCGVTLVLVVVTLAYLACRVLWLGDLGGYRAADGTNRHAAIAVGTTLTYLLEAGAHLLAPGPWDGEDGRGLTILVALVATFTLLLHGGARHVRESVRRGAALVVCMLAALSVTATWATLVGNLGGCRYLYFAAMFWCLGLGWSADLAWSAGGRRRGLMLVACAGLLAGQVVVLRAVNTRWQVGGELAQAAIDGVVERVQSHGTQHAFLFALPVGFKGAHALPWGIEAALALRVGPRLRIDVLPDAAAFERARQMHAQATPTERATIDLGAFDADARSWRWH